MKDSYFIEENQLEEWVEASEGIKEDFGIEKALGYLIGEKFYYLVKDLHFSREMVKIIGNERKSPDYNPIREVGEGKYRSVINRDEEYRYYQNKISMLPAILFEFARLIKNHFQPYEISRYLKSNPRFGMLGHTATEEEQKLFIQHGAVEHSIETEINDALILGEIIEYFGCSH